MSSRAMAAAGCAVGLFVAWAAWPGSDSPQATSSSAAGTVRAVEVRGRPRATSNLIGSISSIAVEESRTYFLDSRNHQVAISEPGRPWKFIGSIGNAPGELFYPTEMAVDHATGNIAVYDGGNERLEIFDGEGRVLDHVSLDRTVFGMAWRWGAEILMGTAGPSALLSTYRPSTSTGGSLGTLASPGELARFQPGIQDTYRTATNRVRIATSLEGDIWVAFIHVGLIRHYAPSGELVCEAHLDLHGLGELPAYAHSVWSSDERPRSASYLNIDGVQLALVIKDLALDPTTGQPIVLLGNNWIGTLASDGHLDGVGPIRGCPWGFHRAAVDGSRESAVLSSLETSSLCEIDLGELYHREQVGNGPMGGRASSKSLPDQRPGKG